jgi:hypothetical protein
MEKIKGYAQFFGFGFFTGRFHPSILNCFARESVNISGGVSLVMVEPAPIVEPRATLTGAINWVSEPTKTSSSMMVWYLLAPS